MNEVLFTSHLCKINIDNLEISSLSLFFLNDSISIKLILSFNPSQSISVFFFSGFDLVQVKKNKPKLIF